MQYLKSSLFLILFIGINLFICAQANNGFVTYAQKEILLQNARIIDVEKETVLEGYSILLANGKITRIDKAGNLKVPNGVTVVDMTGKTILPGLVMLHEHMNYFSGQAVWDHHPVSFPKLYLAAGVTTIRTAGAENPMYDLNLKRRIDNGLAVGPRMFVTGPMFNDSSGGFLGDFVITTYEQARKATAFWADMGCTSFKVYSDISRDALRGVIDEAHARGLMVTGHLGKMSCTEAANFGIDNIEHGFVSCSSELQFAFDSIWTINPNDKKVHDLVDLFVKKKVVLTVTPFSDSDFSDTATMAFLSLDEKERIRSFIKDKPPFVPKEVNERQLRPLEKSFAAKGGQIVLGADAADFGVIPGFQNHNVLISMVKSGWSPINVFKMATIDGARFLRVDKELGSIAVGKAADLFIISGKPDQVIEDIKNVETVFRNGIGYNSKALRDQVRGLVGRH
ncbi:amidohydrolase family protein [Aridibaculum aurantiacum]|uniref:amidohydrolase family protein n=1 Tax=Aridibaculum aurantiacum TaxID=2810307 RepID=UPI001A978C75|nr:amidohydrolase family protein [Aridibaculum aurantiacum]